MEYKNIKLKSRRMAKIEENIQPEDYSVKTSVFMRVICWVGLPISLPVGILTGLAYGESLSGIKDVLLEVYFGIDY